MRYSRVLWCFLLLAACRKPLPINGARCTAGEPNCVCDTQSGECFIQGVNNPGGSNCTPLTCDSIKATCGEFADTCARKTIDCGDCDTGQVCQYQRDSNNQPTSSACIVGSATTCASLGYNCGTYTDPITNQLHDCTKEVNSGQPCASGTSCGGGGQANICGCTPLTCSDLGRVCGDHDGDSQPLQDGCGGFLNCDVQAGGCGAGTVCNFTAGACEATSCTPFTCDQLGNPCGQVGDGCGGLVACAAGACAKGSMCDPTAHTCLSLTKTPAGGAVADPNNPIDSVACQGRGCGFALDACNVDHLCESSLVACCNGANDGSNCTNGEVCVANQCELNPTSSAACPPGRCGSNVKDPLGKTIAACGSANCPSGQLCEPTTGFCMDPGPTSCVAQGRNCGKIYYVDGSGDHSIDCGDTCPVEPGFENSFGSGTFYNEVCGGSGTAGVCALPHAPTVCVEQNAHCGTASDACGNPYLCGACAAGNKCAVDPTVNSPTTNCQACAASDYFTCSAAPYLNQCGTHLDDNCAGTINCGCPDDNSSGAYGPPYTRSGNGVVACTAPDKTAGTCGCTPDPNICKEANACNTTLPDDGCGHVATCGACSAAPISEAAPTVCQTNNNQCCTPDTGACATSCSASATSECNNQAIIDCAQGCPDPAGGVPAGDEKVCGAPCTGNSKGNGGCEPNGSCCANNALYSATGNNCCGDATAVLSTCAVGTAGATTDTCETASTGLCCEPWTCATYLTAHPSVTNEFFTGNLPDGCGGTIAANTCNFCQTNYGTGGAATNGDTFGGHCCQCQPLPCNGNCTLGDLGKRTCVAPAAETAVCTAMDNSGAKTGPEYSSDTVCNQANVCGTNVCDATTQKCCGAGQVVGTAGACCTVQTACTAGQTCGQQIDACLGGTVLCAGCTGGGGVCLTSNACCPAGQQASSGDTFCCSAGETYNAGSNCCDKGCGTQTCGSVGNGDAHACSATVACTGCTGAGGTCTGNTCCASGTTVVAGACCANANVKNAGACCATRTTCRAGHCTDTDGCGNDISGTCTTTCGGGQTCSGGLCACATCGASCPCPTDETCNAGTCGCNTPTCPAGQCGGTFSNSCTTVSCNGPCPGGEVCFNNNCCTPKGQPNDCPCGNTWTDGCGGAPNACDTCGSSGG